MDKEKVNMIRMKEVQTESQSNDRNREINEIIVNIAVKVQTGYPFKLRNYNAEIGCLLSPLTLILY